jgi:hypothetical protein
LLAPDIAKAVSVAWKIAVEGFVIGTISLAAASKDVMSATVLVYRVLLDSILNLCRVGLKEKSSGGICVVRRVIFDPSYGNIPCDTFPVCSR